ncbi:glycoside hydrolase family 99-like domain-containing protein [Prevotella sp. P2-180]|uniref:glycosyltransferase WbsX family protein n=1 Tax=Prevotella sp. P2-180 TaxID=2024224 RepID=UPI000B961D5C|nr:glycoside hydrolase family 99-like domain-containing protein [Prevotella sp. P2-180]OYP65154.1 glycosyl hydrolase [Prevotella sp. P2-180]
MKDKRVIAIHLPQFYPFPENDEWWGKGFTEWRNVTKAKPRFRGHYQPHLPADLGFYDLRLKECRMEQEKLAKEYGIDGFCYYHYWFNGHLIMEKPVEAKLANKEEDLPFMFCWANEDWHRNWAGGYNETLISQNYSKEDDIEHFKYLLPYFKDERYIRVNGKPVFCVYKASLMPDYNKFVETWQALAKENGFELYMCAFEASGEWGKKYRRADAYVEFQPQNKEGFDRKYNPLLKMGRKFGWKTRFNEMTPYGPYVNFQINKKNTIDYKRYPSLCPSWDNACRRVGQPFQALRNANPSDFRRWLDHLYHTFTPFSKEENFIFINAWNEWAEGCHLEPDQKWGRGYLEAIKAVIEKYN